MNFDCKKFREEVYLSDLYLYQQIIKQKEKEIRNWKRKYNNLKDEYFRLKNKNIKQISIYDFL